MLQTTGPRTKLEIILYIHLKRKVLRLQYAEG